MKLNEFARSIPIWTNAEEAAMLKRISGPVMITAFEEREQAIIEGLIRKSLLIKVQGQHAVYVYPNV